MTGDARPPQPPTSRRFRNFALIVAASAIAAVAGAAILAAANDDEPRDPEPASIHGPT